MADQDAFGLGPLDKLVEEYTQSMQSAPGIGAPTQQAKPQEPDTPDIDVRRPTAAPSRARGLLPPTDMVPMFESASRRYDVPVNVLMALAQQESSYDPRVRGDETQWGRAKGMMQYLDGTARMMGINPYDSEQSVDAAAKQLRERLDKGYSMEDAVREHFAGPDRRKWGPKTAQYGESVIGKARQIGAQMYGSGGQSAGGQSADGQDAAQPANPFLTQGNMSTRQDGPMSVPAGTDTRRLNLTAAAPAPEQQDRPGIFDQAMNDFSRGVSNVKNIAIGVGALGADLFGADETADGLLKTYVENSAKLAKENPAVIGTYKNVHSFGDAGRYAVEAVAENLPMMIPSLLSGGVGALAARKIAEKGVAEFVEKQVASGVARSIAEKQAATLASKRLLQGGAAGAATSSVGIETGNIYGDTFKDTGKKTPGLSLAFGVPAGMLDAIEPVYALSKVMGPAVKELAGSVIKRMGAEAGKQFLIEAGTEGLQSMLENAPKSLATGKPYWTADLLDDVVDSALKGGIAGGVIGGTSTGARGAYDAARGTSQEAGSTTGTDGNVTIHMPNEGSGKTGPMGRALQAGNEAANARRVTVTAQDGSAMTGFLDSYQEDGQGGYTARVLGDDGMPRVFSSADGVTIAPQSSSNLPAVIEQPITVDSAGNAATSEQRQARENADFAAQEADRVRREQLGMTPDVERAANVQQARERLPASLDEGQAVNVTTSDGEVIDGTAQYYDRHENGARLELLDKNGKTHRFIEGEVTDIAIQEPNDADTGKAAGQAGEYASLFDDDGNERFASSKNVRDFKKKNGVGQAGLRAIQQSVLDGKPITIDEARKIDEGAEVERKAALEEAKRESQREEAELKERNEQPSGKREFVGEYEIPGIDGYLNKVRVVVQDGKTDAIGIDEGTAHHDLTNLIKAGNSIDQALARMYGDHLQNAEPDASRVRKVKGSAPKGVADATGAANEQPALSGSKALDSMSLDELVEHRTYLSTQARSNNGWNKPLLRERNRVEAAIREIDPSALDQFKTATERKQTDQVEQQTPQVSPSSEASAVTPRVSDITTPQGKPLVELFHPAFGERMWVRKDQWDAGEDRLAAFTRAGTRRTGTTQTVPRNALRSPVEAQAQEAAPVSAAPDRSIIQPVVTEHNEAPAPADEKHAAALERIANGRAWFGDKAKANAFIAKHDLADTHTVEQTGAKRFEVKVKGAVTAPKENGADFGTVFHGTARAFDSFDMKRSGQGGGYRHQGDAVYLTTDDKGYARFFAQAAAVKAANRDKTLTPEQSEAMTDSGGVIMRATVDPKAKILDMRAGDVDPQIADLFGKSVGDTDTAAKLAQRVRDLGYDGIAFTEQNAPEGWKLQKDAATIAVYNPEMVRFERDAVAPSVAIIDEKAAPAKLKKPRATKGTAAQRRAKEIVGADVGDTVAPSERVGHVNAGIPMEITEIGKNGTVYVRNPSTGGQTSLSRGELEGAASAGVTFEKRGAPAVENASVYSDAKTAPISAKNPVSVTKTPGVTTIVIDPSAMSAKPAPATVAPKHESMAGFGNADDAVMSLRRIAHKDERPGDILLNSLNPSYVTVEEAVVAARQHMEPDAWEKPFQFNRVLDIAPRDWQRMVEAMRSAESVPSPDPVAPVKSTVAPEPKPADARFAKNKIFTADRVAAARARLKSKLNQLNSGIDPEVLMDGLTITGAYVEEGVRDFSTYAKAMADDFGDAIKPYLLSFWEGVRNYPGLNAEGMTPADEARAVHAALITDAHRATEAVGEIVEKPAKRTRKTGAKADVTLTQDWGTDHIDGYQDSPDRETGNTTKDAFMKEARQYLNAVSSILTENGYTPHTDAKGRPMKPVSVNESGIAGSGDISLTLAGPDGTGAYVHIGDAALRGVVPSTPSGIAIMFRAAQNGDRYGVKGANQWAPTDLSAADLAALVDAHVKREANHGTEKLDQSGARALAGVPADQVQRAAKSGQVGQGTQGSGRSDAQRNERSGSVGDDEQRSVGSRQGTLSLSDTGDTGAGRSGEQGTRDGGRDSGSALANPRTDVDKPAAGTPAAERGSDYAISDPDEIGKGGAKTKYRNNVAAINLLRQIEAENRPATADEQAILSKFVGWGGLPQAFERSDGGSSQGWSKEVAELKELLSPEEYKAAAASTRNAHYTSPAIVKAMWDGMRRLGFSGGRVLEPSLGVGNFFGLMPADLRNHAAMHGVELDNITGGIAKLLYPAAKITSPMGFQDYTIPDGYFDAAIGNPPFGSEKLYDRDRKDLSGFSIHNYFFAKTLDGLKPNGVMTMVVTNRMMDVTGDSARRYMADRSELLGAVRLPNNAFLGNAGTEVTTDILFLRRLAKDEKPTGESWMDVRDYTDKDGNKVPLNEYFHRHPENMLGDFGQYGSMYSPTDPALVARPDQDTAALLDAALARLPENVAVPAQRDPVIETITPSTSVANVKVGSAFMDGDTVMVRQPDLLGEPQAQPFAFANNRARERVMGMIGVRDALTDLRMLQMDRSATDAQLAAARKNLNAVYDAFTKDNGPINLDANKRLFRDDPTWPQISALEGSFDRGLSATVAKKTGEKARKPSAQKAAIFTKRTQSPYQAPTSAETAKDALVASLAETGRVDLDLMQRLYGKAAPQIVSELGDLVYQDPVKGWVTRDEYLSGNVKAKLAQAQKLTATDSTYQRNVEALTAIQPKDVEAVDIRLKPGASWVPPKHMADFANHISEADGAEAFYNPGTAKWVYRNIHASEVARQKYATGRATLLDVLHAVVNQRALTIYDKHSDGSRSVNETETQLANERAKAVRDEWDNWIWSDDARRTGLSRLYNDMFNTDVRREFDGSHLTLPGKVGNDIIKLRPHQENAVWRIIQSDTTLTDHVVGAGKTYTLVAGAMELRRMGLANKPMFVVPNHLVGQWAADFNKLYPGANVLAASKRDFEKDHRKRLFARIATGDWDAVIVAHSSFGKVEVEPEKQAAYIEEQIADLIASQEALREVSGKSSRNVKDIAEQITKLREKIKKLLDAGSKDDSLYWGELGVDALFVDEFHEFKNLAFSTSMQKVAGLGTRKGSNKATDMMLKIRQVLEATGGRNVITATGTPISNTMAEMYTLQRYLDGKNLAAQGLAHFDAWARQFGEVVTDWELSPSGQYKMNSRFAKFVNMPELMQRYTSFADVVNRDDINRMLASQGKTLPVPKMRGGRPENVVVERSPAQARYIGEPIKDADGNDTEQYPKGTLVWRAENLPKKPEKGADNMLKIMSDARKAALDMRLIDPSAGDYAGSKINVAAGRIVDLYHQWEADKGAQLVFIDLSTPKHARNKEAARIRKLMDDAEAGDEEAQEALDRVSPDEISALESEFSVYDDLKAKLIARGIPENEIAFIHDANTELQKEELFGKVRSGRVRVMFGSTAKMGAGMNVQDRLVALHHMDAPWRPSDLEQREGRIIRQGNVLYDRDPDGFEVDVVRYATKQTLDSRMWQTIEGKARMIEQVRKGDMSVREIEDVGGEAANAAEMKAASSGNPLILEEMTLRNKVRDLENERSGFNRTQFRLRDSIKSTEASLEYSKKQIDGLREDIRIEQPDKFAATIAGQAFDKRKDAGEAILAHIVANGESDLGSYGGFKVRAEKASGTGSYYLVLQGTLDYTTEPFDVLVADPQGVAQRMANAVKGLDDDIKTRESKIRSLEKDLPRLKAQVEPWGKADELASAKTKHAGVIEQLRPKKKTATEAETKPAPEPDAHDNDVAYSAIPVTETPAFKKWFGDSKVVDADGKPMVVYHGTTSDFSAFDAAKAGRSTGTENAEFFFTDSRDVAVGYSGIDPREQDLRDLEDKLEQTHEQAAKYEAEQDAHYSTWDDEQYSPWDYPKSSPKYMPEPAWHKSLLDLEKKASALEREIEQLGSKIDADRNAGNPVRGASVYPVYLSIKNPLIVDYKASGRGTVDDIAIQMHGRLIDEAKRGGHDGVIVKNVFDSPVETDPHVVYIAFRPEQIKSATGNQGTFDPADPDIRYSVAAEAGSMGTSARGMSMLEQQSPLEIHSTAAERGMSNVDLREKVFTGLRDASGLSHPDVGDIAINRKGWSKSRANASDTAKLLTVPKLPEIIQSGAYIGSQPAGKGKSGAYHYIARRLNVDGVPLTALVTVEEHPDGALSYYNHSILNDNFAPTRTGPVDGLLASYRRPTFDAAGPLTRERARPAALRAVRRSLMQGPLGGLIEKLIGEGHIVLHQSENSLPRSVLLKGGSAIQGTTQKGIINLVGENLTPQTAMPVLLHEAFHAKGESLIGTPKWNNLHRQLEGFYKAAQRRKAEGRVKKGDFWDAALRRVEAAERGEATSTNPVEELGAYAIENYDLAPSGIKKWVDNFIGMVKDWLYRRFGIQIGSVTPAQLRALAVAALRSASNTSPQVSRAFGGASMGDTTMGSMEDRYFVNDVMAELAAHDEFFRYPKSTKHSIEGVFSDVVPTIKYVGVEPIIESDRADAHGAERFYRLSAGQGQQIKVYEDNDRVWLDVSELKEGQGGSGVYAAVGNYANNTGRVFIGDPAGLSPIALRRRTEAMLASALKFGTTRHLEPHPDQLAGNKSDGVPPLRWNAGDDLGNVRALIDVSLESLDANVPEFRNARFDFDTKAFVTSDGKPLLDSTLDSWNARRGIRASRAGRNTLKRAIFLASLIRSDVNQRPGLLEQFFNGSAQYVSPGAPLNRVSYSTRERNDAVSDAIHELDGDGSTDDIGGLDDASGRAIRDMRSRYMKYAAHPRHIAALFKDFVPVFKAANDQQHARNQNLEALHKDYLAYDDLKQDGKENVNRVLELGRLEGKVYSVADLRAGVTNPGFVNTVARDENGEPHRVRQPLQASLSKQGDVLKLSADEIRAYQHLRTMFDNALDRFRDQALKDFGFAEFVGMDDPLKAMRDSIKGKPVADPGVARVRNAIDFIEDIEQSKRTGYVPFSRYGDYVIAVKERMADIRYTSNEEGGFLAHDVPDELADTLERIGAAYDPDENAWHVSLDQRDDLERANERTVYSEAVETGLQDRFGKDSEKKVNNREDHVEKIRSVKEAVARITAAHAEGHAGRRVVSFQRNKKRADGSIDMSSLDALAEIAQIDNPTWDAVRGELMKALQAGGFRKHFFHSSHVPGYTTDFQRAMADYMVGMSGYLARRQYNDVWDKAVADIKGGNLHEYATKYRAYFNDPREEFAALRQATFVWMIGANVSSAGVNLTQTLLTTIPTLNQIAGNGLVARELTKAAHDAIKMLSAKAGTDIFDMVRAPADLKDEFAKAHAEGLFLPLNSHDLMGQANQRTARKRTLQKVGNVATSVISLPFSASERFNRIVAFTAAARIARRKGMAERIARHFRNDYWARESFGKKFTPYDFAEWLSQETQYQMGKINRPTMMRGAGAAMLQFKSFTLQTLEKMYRDWTLHGAQGKISTISTLAMLVAFAGVWGAPGADDLRGLLEAIYKWSTSRNIDIKDEMRQIIYGRTGSMMVTDALSSGIPYHFGADMSGRVGMGDILPKQYNKTGYETFDDISKIAGPGFTAFIGGPVRAGMRLSNGDVYGAMQELAPVWVRNPMQATQWATDAVRTKRGDKVLDRSEISNADIAMKAIGVQPSRVSRQYEMSSAQFNAQRGSDDLKRGLKMGLVRALERQSTNTDPARASDFKADVEKAVDKVRDYNRTAERDQIIKLDARSMRSMMQREQMGGQSVVRRAPKASRESAIRRSEAYGIGLGK